TITSISCQLAISLWWLEAQSHSSRTASVPWLTLSPPLKPNTLLSPMRLKKELGYIVFFGKLGTMAMIYCLRRCTLTTSVLSTWYARTATINVQSTSTTPTSIPVRSTSTATFFLITLLASICPLTASLNLLTS
ncbi:hypothetical protein EJ02DRAFT_490596, partial [Clathrospora elynae]